MLARPAVGLVVSVEGLAKPFAGATSLLGNALPDALALAALRRSGLSSASVDVVAPWLEDAIIAGPALRWDASMGGFAAQTGSTLLPENFLGRLACEASGRAVLAELGIRVEREDGACPVFSAPLGGASSVELSASTPAVRQALSEAALIIAIARSASSGAATTDAAALGVTVHRFYATGPAAVAAAFGEGSVEHAAASAVLEAAILAADRLLGSAAAPGRCVTFVLGGSGARDGGSAARLAAIDRSLQLPPDDATPSPSFVPTPIIVTYTSDSIDSYHIVLWTSLLLGGALLAVVYVMLGMDSARDPQLSAQIQDPRASAASHRSS